MSSPIIQPLGSPSNGLPTPLARAQIKRDNWTCSPGISRLKRMLYNPYFCLPEQSAPAAGDSSLRPCQRGSSLSRARQVIRLSAFTKPNPTVDHTIVPPPPMLVSRPGHWQPSTLLPAPPRERVPLGLSTWVSNQPLPNHLTPQLGYKIPPIPGHTSAVHPKRPGQPSSYAYPTKPLPQLGQPLFFPGTSNSSLWGSAGLGRIPINVSGPGGWNGSPRIPVAPLGGQPRVESTTLRLSTCGCASCCAARQLLLAPPFPQPNHLRHNPAVLPSLPPPSRLQSGTAVVPARQPPILDDSWGDEDPLEPRHRLPPSTSSYTYQSEPSTLEHHGVAFNLSQFLGKGAAGRVALAKRRGRLYAVKAIHKRNALKLCHTRDDFLREKKCMVAIGANESSKRFLMPLVMAWEEWEMIYFVMPFYPVDLHAALESGIPTWKDRYMYCMELICALCELRRLGIAHRDIKPSNILVAQDGRVVLTDFGMAQLVPPVIYEIWQCPGFSGTYAYMAPEMVREGPHHGTVADVWSMGLVFLEILMISRGRYFKAVNVEDIRREHATMLPTDAALQPALIAHSSMAGLIISMLQADPSKRITAQRLQGEYVLSEAWSDVREGYATHDWKPHLDVISRPPAGRLLDFLTFRAHEDPIAAMRDNQKVWDTDQFEYCTPEVFGFCE
ncbi:transporter [Ganoderma sinense ZZ0214-1]|uniref:Transporter n=1 Tax=Ganoderma sinense ZZ0214-1 TaxID=1077348 RepID=A0A2G8SHP1_9APHY|nr:transporter [Ganoderma sinense ZZ0214-1]